MEYVTFPFDKFVSCITTEYDTQQDSILALYIEIAKYLRANPIVSDLTVKEIIDKYLEENPPASGVVSVNGKTGVITGLYDAENPPPYPVTKVNGMTGEVTTLRVDPDDPGIPTDPPVPINATTLNGKDAKYYLSVRNMLDNSNFEIAQAGYSGLHGTKTYACDRWEQYTETAIEKVDAGLKIAKNSTGSISAMWQHFNINKQVYMGKILTLAVKVDGELYAGSVEVIETTSAKANVIQGNGFTAVIKITASGDKSYVEITPLLTTPVIVQWAGLYEGSYTADNLPPYAPKGYAAELAECQRYYRRSFDDGVSNISYVGMPIVIAANSTSLQTVNFDTPMRTTPTIITYGYKNKAAYSVTDWNADSDIPNIIVPYISRHGFNVGANASTFTTGGAYCFHYEAIADL